MVGALWASLLDTIRVNGLPRLFVESMGFEGCYKVCKDYLQPLLQSLAVALPVMMYLAGRQRTALLVTRCHCALVIFLAQGIDNTFEKRLNGHLAARFTQRKQPFQNERQEHHHQRDE